MTSALQHQSFVALCLLKPQEVKSDKLKLMAAHLESWLFVPRFEEKQKGRRVTVMPLHVHVGRSSYMCIDPSIWSSLRELEKASVDTVLQVNKAFGAFIHWFHTCLKSVVHYTQMITRLNRAVMSHVTLDDKETKECHSCCVET